VGAAAQREGTDPVSATAARARVLVVDDQPIICSMLRRELQGRFVVDVAANGAEAVARIREGGDYALILCDLMMPEVTGVDVHRRTWPARRAAEEGKGPSRFPFRNRR
jgi:CheY-like chemotaxis protein